MLFPEYRVVEVGKTGSCVTYDPVHQTMWYCVSVKGVVMELRGMNLHQAGSWRQEMSAI